MAKMGDKRMDIARIEVAVHANYMQVRYEIRDQFKPLQYVQHSFGNPDVLQPVIEGSVSLRDYLNTTVDEYQKIMNGVPNNSYFYAKVEYKNDFSAPEIVEMRWVSQGTRIELHKKFSNNAPAKLRAMVVNRVYSALISASFTELSSVIDALK